MSDSRVAARYAKAILELAVDSKATDTVEKDMRGIVATIAESLPLREMLMSSVVKADVKKSALLAIFKGYHDISEGLISLLVSNKRITLLNAVAEKFIILNEDLKGKGVAFVTTAVPLTDALEQELLKKITALTGKKVVIENTVDEDIVGGFVLRVGDLQYDASIANKLNNLKREFTNSL